MTDYPEVVEIVVEISDGDVYVVNNIPNNVPVVVTLYDYDEAENRSLEEALSKTAEVASGPTAIDGSHRAFQDYVQERSLSIQP